MTLNGFRSNKLKTKQSGFVHGGVVLLAGCHLRSERGKYYKNGSVVISLCEVGRSLIVQKKVGGVHGKHQISTLTMFFLVLSTRLSYICG